MDISDSEDPEGLRVFYYLVQDLKVRTSPRRIVLDSEMPFAVLHLLAHLPPLQDQAHLNVLRSKLPVLLAAALATVVIL